jgi:O-antigen/teichoic acid export membrane protein
MSAASSATLERRALSLGTANAVDFGLQFLLPMVLTRTLDAYAFGEYRLLWLAVATLMVITPMCMAPALYYFLPRSDRPTQRLYINQTMVFLLAAGAISAWALSHWNPFLPGALSELVNGNGHVVVPAFVLVWIFASILDVLPTAEERVSWQAKVIMSLSATRAVALSAVAIATRELQPVLWTLLAFALLKAGILLSYVVRHHGWGGPWGRKAEFSAQVRQAAPFAASGALHGFRMQADQWIVAAMFSVAQFASFSIATVMAPIVQIFRQSVNNVFLPSMSRLQASGNSAEVLALNSRANCMVALLVFPLLAFAFVFAESLVAFVYTRTYLEAVPVLRLYIVGLVAFVVEVVSVLFVLQQGGFAARVNLVVLAVAVPLSLFGATTWGLTGAALGTVSAVYLERIVSLRRIARLTSTPVRRLQDWASLAGMLAAAVLAALVAGVALHWSAWSSFAKLVAGGLVLAAAYPLTLYLTGQWRHLAGFIATLRAARS